MPFSYSNQLSTIVGYAEQQNPSTILDVVSGWGNTVFCYAQTWKISIFLKLMVIMRASVTNESGESELMGLKVIQGYINPVHEYAYTDLYIGDALEILPTLQADAYDLVLAIDILEHFDKGQGSLFLQECQRVSKNTVLVNTPRDFIEPEVVANPLENHRFHWTE